MRKLILVFILISALKVQGQFTWDKHWDIKAHEVGQLHFNLGTALPLPAYSSDSGKGFQMLIRRIDNGAFDKYDKEKDFILFGGGPLYARFEYGLSRKLSVQAGITFTNYKARFSRDSLDPYIGRMIPWEYGLIVNNISYIARLNYHMYVDTRWDVYFGGGAGYDTYKATSYSKYPPQSLLFNAYFKAPAPVTFEAGAGFKYFFLNRTAVYCEVGYGKTFVQAGVSVKVIQPKKNRSY